MEFGKSVGLVADPWQAHVLEGALGEVGDLWAAFEVGLIVSRQNGKGGILELRELAGIRLFGERLIVHTAHQLKTAEEARLRMEQICEASPDLDREVKRVVRTNGKEAIEFKNGARIKYAARSKGSGRGFSGDLIVFDEAMFLDQESMAALLPTLSTSPNPQVWYAASAGLPESTQLASVRDRAMRGNDPSLAFFEWSAEDDSDLDDPEAWAQANPALGIRITERFIRVEREALSDEDFARERLGIWSSGTSHSVIDPDVWQKLVDEESQTSGEVTFAVDMPPNRSHASIAVAGARADGLDHIELVPSDELGNYLSGTAWVTPRLVELVEKYRAQVALDPSSPAGSLIPELQGAGIEPVLVSGREMAQACGAFYDAVVERGSVRHLGQPKLNVAVDAARKRTMGDAWAWHRKSTSSDISPLVAVTLALHLSRKPSKRKPKTGRAVFA